MKKSELLKTDSSIGINLAAGMVVFAGIGFCIDKKFQTGPWGLLTGIFLGLVYGAYEVWKLLKRLKED